MDPQGSEGNNNQPPAVNAAAVVDSSLNANPLDKLEGVVAAVKQEAAAAQQIAPVEAVAETPKGQFENQFGSGPTTPPVAESTSGLIDTALANLGTTPSAGEDLSANNNQPPAETPQQPEQTPEDKLKQKISDDIDAFLEEVRQKQGVTS